MRAAVAVAVFVAVQAGCVGVRNEKVEVHTDSYRAPVGRSDEAKPVLWRQIELGYRPRTTPLGFLKTEEVDGGEQHWVYGTQFELIGQVSPRGRTIRFDRRGYTEVEVEEGSYLLRHALLKLFGHTKDRGLQLEPMPSPEQG